MFLADASSINEAVIPAMPHYYYFNRVAQSRWTIARSPRAF
jgi:hypothetical protein